MDDAEQNVEAFYRDKGWATSGGVTEDASRWEDLRPSSSAYVTACRRRVLRHIQGSNRILDMASGPIQYDEYLEFSKYFKQRHCIDLSEQALTAARNRIGEHGVFWQGSFFDYDAPDDYFDCAISLHTIYHMAAERQEEAVRKLLKLTNGPVVIVYSNPNAILSRLKRFFKKTSTDGDLYFAPHPVAWWKRFEDTATVKVLPWRAFAANEMQTLIPSGFIGKAMLAVLYKLEDWMPSIFVKHFRYNMVVLQKKT